MDSVTSVNIVLKTRTKHVSMTGSGKINLNGGLMIKRALKLLKEPSTYAGFAGLLGGAGVLSMSEDQWLQIFGAVAAVAGAVAMFMLDPGDKAED